jgi:NAD(P)-dependent dehydrogenase (short-subunit alcohol dehydrogenase family)
MKLAGRIGLVTGAQQGIGAAIAIALAQEGADVAITWLDNEPAAESVAARIRKAGRRAHLIRADVTRLADIEAMVADTVRVLGPGIRRKAAVDVGSHLMGRPSI